MVLASCAVLAYNNFTSLDGSGSQYPPDVLRCPNILRLVLHKWHFFRLIMKPGLANRLMTSAVSFNT